MVTRNNDNWDDFDDEPKPDMVFRKVAWMKGGGEWVPRNTVYEHMTDEEKKQQDEIDDGMDEYEERKRQRIAEANEY